mmetsp:Transcript_34467/g.70396  ORF Transcript_34467/g.70396 Transcript_34467/m.70396 type:complete len:319 (+) Transcript_34467:1133-2089(+)
MPPRGFDGSSSLAQDPSSFANDNSQCCLVLTRLFDTSLTRVATRSRERRGCVSLPAVSLSRTLTATKKASMKLVAASAAASRSAWAVAISLHVRVKHSTNSRSRYSARLWLEPPSSKTTRMCLNTFVSKASPLSPPPREVASLKDSSSAARSSKSKMPSSTACSRALSRSVAWLELTSAKRIVSTRTSVSHASRMAVSGTPFSVQHRTPSPPGAKSESTSSCSNCSNKGEGWVSSKALSFFANDVALFLREVDLSNRAPTWESVLRRVASSVTRRSLLPRSSGMGVSAKRSLISSPRTVHRVCTSACLVEMSSRISTC